MFIIQDSVAGNKIASFSSLDEAKSEVAKYEQTDKEEGTYEEDFYEIIEEDNWHVRCKKDDLNFIISNNLTEKVAKERAKIWSAENDGRIYTAELHEWSPCVDVD